MQQQQALLYVGVLMMSNVKNIDFSSPKSAVPAFVTIAMMPFAYSITDGIGLGLITYVIISIFTFFIDLIKYACHKGEKPKWDILSIFLSSNCLIMIKVTH